VKSWVKRGGEEQDEKEEGEEREERVLRRKNPNGLRGGVCLFSDFGGDSNRNFPNEFPLTGDPGAIKLHRG
jgi:hypothetical protein